MQHDKERFLAEGMDYYLAKPFQNEELESLLGDITSRESSR